MPLFPLSFIFLALLAPSALSARELSDGARDGQKTSSQTFVAATSNWFLHYMGKPAECYENCDLTIQALGRSLGVPVRFEVIDEFEEFHRRMRDGSVDIGLLRVWEYLRMECREGVVPVVRPVITGGAGAASDQQLYFLIVLRGSPVEDFRQLRGSRLVYRDRTAPALFSSFVLEPQGEKIGDFFKERIDVGHTRNDFEMLHYRQADAALITYFQWNQAAQRDPRFLEGFKKVLEFGVYPNAPIFARRGTPPEMLERIKTFFTGLHESEKGRELLAFWGFERFTAVAKNDYAELKAFYKKIGIEYCR